MGGNSHTPGGWGGFPRADYKIDARAPQAKPTSAVTSTNARLPDVGAWNFMFHGSPVSARTGQYAPAAPAPTASAAPSYDPALNDPSLQSPGYVPGMPANFMRDGNAGPTGATGVPMPSLADAKAPQVPRWGVPPISSGYDPLMTPKPFMPHSSNDKFTVPASGISPVGSGISVGELGRQSGANLAANKAMAAPGGAAGFWGGVSSAPAANWQAPTALDANQIAAKYASKPAIAMNNWLMQKPLSNG